MKIIYSRTYEYELDADSVKDELRDILVGGLGIFTDEEDWRESHPNTLEDWETVKKDYEEEFYSNYPKDEVLVVFPPTTLEDLVRLQAWDVKEEYVDPENLFGNPAVDEWVIVDDGEEETSVTKTTK